MDIDVLILATHPNCGKGGGLVDGLVVLAHGVADMGREGRSSDICWSRLGIGWKGKTVQEGVGV